MRTEPSGYPGNFEKYRLVQDWLFESDFDKVMKFDCGDDGVVVIKAQSYRTQEKNRAEALQRLDGLLEKALFTAKKRTPTRPGKSARKKRTDQKTQRGKVKVLRGKIRSDE